MQPQIDAVVYIVHHGQTHESLLDIAGGRVNAPLGDIGRKQARNVAWHLRHVPFNIAFSSDHEKAAETAKIILGKQSSKAPLNQFPILREREIGSRVETLEEFTLRTLYFWDWKLLTYLEGLRNLGSPANILVVVHGTYISTFVNALLEHRDLDVARGVLFRWCPNGSVTRLEMKRYGGGMLRTFGEVPKMVNDDAGQA